MRLTLSKPWTRAVSGLLLNLSAAWFGIVLVVPTFFSRPDWLFVLTVNVTYGIVSLWASVELDKLLEHE